MVDERKRKSLLVYFWQGSVPLAVFLMLLFVVPGILYIVWAMVRKAGRPLDSEFDVWLAEDLARVTEESYHKLGLDKADERDRVRDPIALTGPVAWEVSGVPKKEVKWRKGKDEIARFSVNTFTVLHFMEFGVAAYTCDFNMLRGVALNETTHEFHYNDIVSVSTQEESSSYTLKNGTSMIHAQAFRLSVASGENISYVISAPKLTTLTGGRIPTTEAERAVQVIRKLLRDRKGSRLHGA